MFVKLIMVYVKLNKLFVKLIIVYVKLNKIYVKLIIMYVKLNQNVCKAHNSICKTQPKCLLSS